MSIIFAHANQVIIPRVWDAKHNTRVHDVVKLIYSLSQLYYASKSVTQGPSINWINQQIFDNSPNCSIEFKGPNIQGINRQHIEKISHCLIEFKDLIIKSRYVHLPSNFRDRCNMDDTGDFFYFWLFFSPKYDHIFVISEMSTLIFVQSTPSKRDRRDAIRTTWTNPKNSLSIRVRVNDPPMKFVNLILQNNLTRVFFIIGNGESITKDLYREVGFIEIFIIRCINSDGNPRRFDRN